MKKILTIAIMFISVVAMAQDEAVKESKAQLGIMVGPSFPIGDYADNDIDNEDAGSATMGILMELNFNYYLSSNIGFGALIRSQANGVDGEPILDGMLEDTDVGTSGEVETGGWGTGLFMAGMVARLPIADNFYLTSRLFIGMATTLSPEVTAKLENTNEIMVIKLEQSSTSNFAYLPSLGLSYDISNKLNLSLNMDVISYTAEFENVKSSTNWNGFYFESTDNFDMQITTINLGVGLAYNF